MARHSHSSDTQFHALEIEDTLLVLSATRQGLTTDEATVRLETYGKNIIHDSDPINILKLLYNQFKSVLVLILLIAALISYATGHLTDSLVIIAIIIINGAIGFFQEYRADKSIQALKKLIIPTAKVIRDDKLQQIAATELVPGDIIQIKEGDRIPADARLIEAVNLRTNEASITGESLPSNKGSEKLKEDTPTGDRSNMLWMGTSCATGKALAVVTATGEDTQLGEIASDIKKIKTAKTHFEIITATLGKQMAVIAIIGSILIFFAGLLILNIELEELFLMGIATLVSAIPEGLPAVLTIVLAIGARRMAKRNAIIRNLSATETIGIVNVIATDKTGTLTQNTMNVEELYLPKHKTIFVTGTGWENKGSFLLEQSKVNVDGNPQLKKLLHIALLCNNSEIIRNDEGVKIIGDPTEAALRVLAEKGDVPNTITEKIISDTPFSNDTKLRSTLVEEDKHYQIYVAGAPEEVIKLSKNFMVKNKVEYLDEKSRDEFNEIVAKMSKKALRVIALAYRNTDQEDDSYTNELENLTIVGLVGMMDPPREEAAEAIEKAQKAGIRVLMLTGDHKETAIAIAKKIGLASGEHPGYAESDLAAMSEEEFSKAVSDVNIFARLTPRTKLRIAQKLQEQGNIIAMTGDGVNDAPALKQANVGISMGLIGTDIARDSSEIVLADDNFSSIVNAIEEGRIVFMNVRRSSSFLVTTNIAEQLTILVNILIGFPIPLLPAQILWLNLVSDGVNDIALATEKSHGTVLTKKPRKPKEGILTTELIIFITIVSIVMMAITFVFFRHYLDESVEQARTAAFLAMTFTQLFNVFNLRSFTKSIFKIGLFTNRAVIYGFVFSTILTFIAVYSPFFQGFLKFSPIEPELALLIFILSSLVLWVGELFKFLRYEVFRV